MTIETHRQLTFAELQTENPVIGSDAFSLSPLQQNDAAAFLGLVVFDRQHLCQYGEQAGYQYVTEADVLQELTRKELPRLLSFGMRANRQLVGILDLEAADAEGISAAVGYWVGKQHLRKGYASASLGLLSRYSHDVLGYESLEAYVAPDNVASIATIKRAGFTCNGTILCRRRSVTGVERQQRLGYYVKDLLR